MLWKHHLGNLYATEHLVMKENKLPDLSFSVQNQHVGSECSPPLKFLYPNFWLILQKVSFLSVKVFTKSLSDFIFRASEDAVETLPWTGQEAEASLIKTQTMDGLSHFQPCPMERLSSTH